MSSRAPRSEHRWELEAHELWDALGRPAPPIDSFKLCAILGLRIGIGRDPASDLPSHLHRRERRVYLDPTASDTQRAFAAAHEAVHYLRPDIADERRINYLTMALLMPREHAEPLVRATWDLWELSDALAPRLSFEVVARRVISLDPSAAISIWREGRCKAAMRSPALRFQKPADLERDMATELFARRDVDRIERTGRAHAVADDTSDGRFVITVAELPQLQTA